jgi:hypothetical protein
LSEVLNENAEVLLLEFVSDAVQLPLIVAFELLLEPHAPSSRAVAAPTGKMQPARV